MNETIVDFSIFSETIKYDEISTFLWENCDSFCNKWWRINNKDKWAINNTNIWIKWSWIWKREDDLGIHFQNLHELLFPIKAKLLKLKENKCEFKLSIIIYSENINPCGYIKSKYIKFFWELWADIDFDIYYLWNG